MNTQPEVQKTVQKKAAPKSTMSGVLDQIGQGKFFKTQKTTEEIDAQLLLKKNELQKTGAIVKEKPQDLAGVLFSALQSKGLLNTNDTEDEDNEGWDDEPSYTPSTQSQVSTQAGEKEVQPELKPTTSKITTSELTKPETPQKKKTSKEIHEEEVAQEKTTQALKLGLASRRAAIANNDDDDD
ncbi:hypothetical protein Bealeia1_01242 [Candidatus Bealeia paramacronuclearis]|uniref:Uncharacterized protein n=1 Tax=Candidatus Bealeia paramacronuclearis TaxID=1921001 RepID=A0ABZ2C3P4_9PROT|nr:hypothetical protein [Candidatus Bealeia paramacronuclearis]